LNFVLTRIKETFNIDQEEDEEEEDDDEISSSDFNPVYMASFILFGTYSSSKFVSFFL
jgi:hypothetical protein